MAEINQQDISQLILPAKDWILIFFRTRSLASPQLILVFGYGVVMMKPCLVTNNNALKTSAS